MKKYFEVMFKINKKNLDIKKAIMQFTIVFIILSVSVLIERPDLGLTALLGSFSHVYIINGSYPSRIRKVITISIMLSMCLMVGTLAISIPFLYAFILGLIGTIGHFILKAFKVPGPSSVFFILTYSVASIMPIEPESAFLRGFLVLLGGVVSICVVLVDAYFNHRKPENESVLLVYKNLSYLMAHFDGKSFVDAREQMLQSIQDASATLTSANAFWNKTKDYNRLILLKRQAEAIWSECLELSSKGYKEIPIEIKNAVDYICKRLDGENPDYNMKYYNGNDKNMIALVNLIYTAEAILNESKVHIDKKLTYRKISYKKLLKENLSSDSFILMSSIKYGIILFTSVIIAFGIGFERAYWIPISCCAVLLGATVLSTIQRGFQRMLGTLLGMLIAILILHLEPGTWYIVILMSLFMGVAELLIAANYAMAVIFITPNVLLMSAAVTNQFDTFLVLPRIVDVVIGSTIGLLGVLLVGRKQASKKLPKSIANTLRRQSQLLHALYATDKHQNNITDATMISDMNTEILNTKAIYQAALHEIDNDVKQIEFMYPIIFSVEHLGFTLERVYYGESASTLDDKALGLYLMTYENLCKKVLYNLNYDVIELPEIKAFPSIKTELMKLQNLVGQKNGNKELN